MSTLKVEQKGHVLLMELNRPQKMNAFNLEMLQALADAYTQLEDTEELRCGLLYAAGKHFTAGLDLAEVGPHVAKGNSMFDISKVHPLQTLGRARSKPVVVAVQGYCLTIGIELLLAADIAVAHPETTFGQIEIKRGIFPFGGATIRMPQRCGWGNAMRYLLTGDYFDGQEAYRIGMVQELAEDPFERALAISETIAAQAPLGVQATLINARRALAEGEAAALTELLELARRLMATEDAAEGMQSFLQRREARFKGR